MPQAKPYSQRKSLRLAGYDYSQDGAYFITILTAKRQPLFGQIIAGQTDLTAIGQLAEAYWQAIPAHFPAVRLDEFVIMPNHMHGIIWLQNSQSKLGAIIGSYKAAVTRQARLEIDPVLPKLWHRGYYDHIIQHELALSRIRAYIRNNPVRWQVDRFRLSAG